MGLVLLNTYTFTHDTYNIYIYNQFKFYTLGLCDHGLYMLRLLELELEFHPLDHTCTQPTKISKTQVIIILMIMVMTIVIMLIMMVMWW